MAVFALGSQTHDPLEVIARMRAQVRNIGLGLIDLVVIFSLVLCTVHKHPYLSV